MHDLGSSFINGDVSYWFRDARRAIDRPPLDGDLEVDVAIAGAGMTGLWLAYYLALADPGLTIAIVEKEFAGFGASGRNGGWLSGEPPGLLRRYAAEHGWAEAIRFQRAVFDTIDEVQRVLEEEDIDADLVKDGLMYVATSAAQHRRLLAHADDLRTQGWEEADLRLLTADEVTAQIAIDGARGGYWTPHCARIQPAKLVTGLAAAVERLGVRILEHTEVMRVAPRRLATAHGQVRARHVVTALEGYQSRLPGGRRRMLPMNSSMIVTEPVDEATWDRIGWRDARLLADHAHSYAYSQRTRDGRIAIGGRGVPYRFASSFDPSGTTPMVTVRQLKAHLGELLPATRDVGVDHAWSGVLGVPRDWTASVTYDPATGLGAAGGYTGHGVAGTNLGARTLADLILGRDTALTSLPWVGRHSRSWEPEPLRWVGARSLYAAYRYADRRENAVGTARTSRIAQIADTVSGRH
jgi:glycine/D-amino acid oxidase-like deaminating enzyme